MDGTAGRDGVKDDEHVYWRCKILQIRMPFDRDTFGSPFNTLIFQDHVDIEPERDAAVCVSTDEASHIQTVFTVSEYRPDYKITTVVVNPERGEEEKENEDLSGDLLINIFVLPLCRPVLDVFPLRRKPADENRPRRIATPANATIAEPVDGAVGALLTVSADGIRWGKSVDSASGRFRIFATLVAKVPEVYGTNGRLRFRFARIVWLSDAYGELSKLVLNGDVLNLYLAREESVGLCPGRPRRPPPTGLCLRLQLTKEEALEGPYFSGAGSPYFFDDRDGKCLGITAPYDFSVSRDHVHRLRTYRKFYGTYVGIFVPKFDVRLKITPEVWYPRNWLDITVSSQDDENVEISYGEVLGNVYFSDTEYDIYPHHEEEYADEVRSRIVRGEVENVSVIGLTIVHDNVPDLRVKTNGRYEPTSRTLIRALAQ